MPLPKEAEQAADTVATQLERLDHQIADHIATGRPLPSVTTVMTPITAAVSKAVVASIRGIGGNVTTRTVTGAVNDVVTPIRQQVAEMLRLAKRARRRMPRKPPATEPDTDGTIADLIKKAGPGAAVLLLLARRPAKDRTPELIRQVTRQAGIRAPRPLSAYGKMVVRTRVAMARNTHAADVVDINNGDGGRWAVFIRDGLNGPTDHECERVNRRWATAIWLRNHLTAHPNCTREGRPGQVPEGQRITLLR